MPKSFGSDVLRYLMTFRVDEQVTTLLVRCDHVDEQVRKYKLVMTEFLHEYKVFVDIYGVVPHYLIYYGVKLTKKRKTFRKIILRGSSITDETAREDDDLISLQSRTGHHLYQTVDSCITERFLAVCRYHEGDFM